MSGELLRACAVHGEVDKMKVLLAGGANPCSTDDAGLTPLHFAVWNGKTEATLVLLANPVGSNEEGVKVSCINFVSKEGWTPLHLCAWDGMSAACICRYLLLAGADRSLRDKNGRCALEFALEEENGAAAEVLRSFRVHKRDRKAFRKETLAPFAVVKRRRRSKETLDFVPEPLPPRPLPPFRALVRQTGPCRADLVQYPPKLKMPDHRLYYHVQKHYHERRSAANLREIVSAVEQLEIETKRQEDIVHEQSRILD